MSAIGQPGLIISGKDERNVLSFDLDLVVIGYIAAHWADTGSQYRCCMPGWGMEYRGRSVTVGNDRWVVTKMQRDWKGKTRALGLMIVKKIDALNGGETERQWWVPIEACRNVRLVIEGVELN